MAPLTTLDDVQRCLLDRILSGFYPAGSRLPSVRALAEELGTNPSTVDRAVARLATAGRLRTVPRYGVFVERLDGPTVAPRAGISRALDDVLLRARRQGLTGAELGQLVAAALDRMDAVRRIAVVECNERDLRTVQQSVQTAAGVEVQPVLLSQAQGRYLDDEFAAVAVPIFHLNDVAPVVRSFDRVVELNLVASAAALRTLVDVRDEDRLVVVAPTERGVQWMTAVVGQYFPGRIDSVEIGKDDPSVLLEAPVVVVNNAADLDPALTARLRRPVFIEWELDPRFRQTLQARVDAAVQA